MKYFFNLRIVLLWSLFILLEHVFAVPASSVPVLITQPDGTKLTLKMFGDEYLYWQETTNGQIVIPNSNGIYEYALLRDNTLQPSGITVNDNTLLPSGTTLCCKDSIMQYFRQKRNILLDSISSISGEYRSQSINTTGNQKVLCILIDFPDRSFSKTTAEFDSLWNGINYNTNGANGSVNKYYLENSFNQLNVKATIVGPYTAQHNSSYYDTGTNASTISSSNVRELVQEAIVAAKNDIQFQNFDMNNDKFVDCVHIIFSGYSKDEGGTAGTIWSHHWSLTTPIYQGIYKAQDYIITSELSGGSGNNIATIGTICHEYGHRLGSPDFYDVNYSGYPGTGRWDVMGSGSHNNSGKCPAHHNPYTKAYIYHWCTPTNISSTTNTYTLIPSHNANSIYQINTSTIGEYFLLENKNKTSNTFNYYVPNSGGLLIYHIHSDIASSISNNTVNTNHPQKCYIVSAHATTEPDSTPSSYDLYDYYWAYPRTNNIFFTYNSTPKAVSWNSIPTSINLCFIRRDGQNIKFDVNPAITGTASIYTNSSFVYSIGEVPSTATISWSYTTSSGTSPVLPIPITFPNGNTSSSTTLQIGGSPSPLLYNDSSPFTTEDTINGRPTPKYFFVLLKATITCGSCTYQITKNLKLTIPSSPLLNECDNNNSNDITKENSIGNPIKYQLVTSMTPNGISMRVNQINNDLTEPYTGKYSLELWNDKLGLINHISEQTAECFIKTNTIPNGIYYILLIIDNDIKDSIKTILY